MRRKGEWEANITNKATKQILILNYRRLGHRTKHLVQQRSLEQKLRALA